MLPYDSLMSLLSSIIYLFFTPCERSGTSPSSPQAGLGPFPERRSCLHVGCTTHIRDLGSFLAHLQATEN